MDCSVCMERKKRSEMFKCPWCFDDAICVECTGCSLYHPDTKIECMVCHHPYDMQTIWEIFTEDIFYKTLEKVQNSLLLQQRALLPATMRIVEEHRKIDDIKNKFNKLLEKRQKIDEKITELLLEYDDVRTTLGSDNTQYKYEYKCPGEGCKGYIKKGVMVCSLCDTHLCKKCLGLLPVGGIKHVCKKADIESAKTIMKETKPCPVCAARIHKIEGCSQMYCVSCKTAFNWNTGKIETGIIHNPHFYEENGHTGNQPFRVRGDLPCGGLIPILGFHHSIDYLYRYRLVAEVQDYLTSVRPKDLLVETRVKYLMGKIPEEDFKQELYNATLTMKMIEDEKEILYTFLACMIERFIELGDTTKKWVEEIEREMDLIIHIIDQSLYNFCETHLSVGEPYVGVITLDMMDDPVDNFELYF